MYMTVHHPVPSPIPPITITATLSYGVGSCLMYAVGHASGWNDVNNGHNGLDGIYRGFKACSSSDIIRQWFDIAVQ